MSRRSGEGNRSRYQPASTKKSSVANQIRETAKHRIIHILKVDDVTAVAIRSIIWADISKEMPGAANLTKNSKLSETVEKLVNKKYYDSIFPRIAAAVEEIKMKISRGMKITAQQGQKRREAPQVTRGSRYRDVQNPKQDREWRATPPKHVPASPAAHASSSAPIQTTSDSQPSIITGLSITSTTISSSDNSVTLSAISTVNPNENSESLVLEDLDAKLEEQSKNTEQPDEIKIKEPDGPFDLTQELWIDSLLNSPQNSLPTIPEEPFDSEPIKRAQGHPEDIQPSELRAQEDVSYEIKPEEEDEMKLEFPLQVLQSSSKIIRRYAKVYWDIRGKRMPSYIQQDSTVHARIGTNVTINITQFPIIYVEPLIFENQLIGYELVFAHRSHDYGSRIFFLTKEEADSELNEVTHALTLNYIF